MSRTRLAALLALLALLVAPQPGLTQAPQPRRAAPISATVTPCDLRGDPQSCSACAALAAAVREEIPASPPRMGGVFWTPFYIAFRLDCRDVGRTLLSRGADPLHGGRNGALLPEIAAMRFADTSLPLGMRQTRASEWVNLIARSRPYDVDQPLEDGLSSRQGWEHTTPSLTNPAELNAASAIWARIVAQGSTSPVLVPGGERISPDFPAAETGATRPSETAVSRGVERMLTTFRSSGMAGVSAQVQRCYGQRWSPETVRHVVRWNLEICAAMDLAASDWDGAAASEMRFPRTPMFLPDEVEARIAVMRQFASAGLNYAAWRENLRRTVPAWIVILATAIAPEPR